MKIDIILSVPPHRLTDEYLLHQLKIAVGTLSAIRIRHNIPTALAKYALNWAHPQVIWSGMSQQSLNWTLMRLIEYHNEFRNRYKRQIGWVTRSLQEPLPHLNPAKRPIPPLTGVLHYRKSVASSQLPYLPRPYYVTHRENYGLDYVQVGINTEWAPNPVGWNVHQFNGWAKRMQLFQGEVKYWLKGKKLACQCVKGGCPAKLLYTLANQ